MVSFPNFQGFSSWMCFWGVIFLGFLFDPMGCITILHSPATGQSIEPNMPLFPGYCADGQKRCWDKPISARAYLGKIHEAARSLTHDKTAASAIGVKHAFQEEELGTHSMKNTAVTVMAEAAVSWSIISRVTGTSVRMLQDTYDISTPNVWFTSSNHQKVTNLRYASSMGKKWRSHVLGGCWNFPFDLRDAVHPWTREQQAVCYKDFLTSPMIGILERWAPPIRSCDKWGYGALINGRKYMGELGL